MVRAGLPPGGEQRIRHDTGHAHPHRDAAIANYRGLLTAMGKTEAKIAATFASARVPLAPAPLPGTATRQP
jgi:hypothetical protein